MAGSRAVSDREPGQVRKEAALSGPAHAPRTNLAGAKARRARPKTLHDDGCTVHFFRLGEAISHAEDMSTAVPARRGSKLSEGARVLIALLAVMWLAEIVDTLANNSLDQYGIEPRSAEGLAGIAFSPFLHAGFGHLISNSIPLLVMGLGIALAGAARVVSVTIVVALVAGLGTWLTAPAGTDTIGASGIVFGYATYLMTRFFFSRRILDLVLGVVVLAVWGTSLLASLSPTPGVSWQAHLFGAVGGVLAARFLTPGSEGRGARRIAPS
jgi:membrane associated rhomboid family serine protease